MLLSPRARNSVGDMAKGREAQQVAKRAVILGAIAFRSSLEVTSHPRVVEFSERLLPWLIEVGCDDELDPIEREELSTSLGQLSESQMMDVRWAGESAAIFCWMLKLREDLDEKNLADQSSLPDVLGILKPEAVEVIRLAVLRSRSEIVDRCRQFVLVRSMLQESRVGPPASDIVRGIHVQKLKEVGVSMTDDAVKQASGVVSRMSAEDRKRVAALYFIRHHAAMWFLSDRASYFSTV